MRPDFLPFSRPSISEDDISAVAEVLRSGWITTGPKTAAFEDEFAKYVGCPHAVAMCSATGAMDVLLEALDIGPGDEVITPSLTWVSIINLTVLAGAKPVFVDIDRDTLMITPEAVAERLTPKTKLIMPVHYAGAAADIDGIRKVAARSEAVVVDDAAHAVGTYYKGQHVGKTGTSIFSFHPIKNITTGEGGMFCSDDDKLIERVKRLKFHGLGVDAFDRKMQGRSPQAEVVEPGLKYNLTDVAGVLGLCQLRRVNEFNRKRKELALYYRERLSEVEEVLPLKDPNYDMTHSWHLFIVRIDSDKAGLSREQFMEGLKERNIGTGIHFRAAHVQRFYREQMGFERGMLPNTEWNSDRICSLPLFPDMTLADVDSVVEAIKQVVTR